jgi:ribosomal protein L37AE/L43A
VNIHLCSPAVLYVRAIRTCPACRHRGRWAGFEQIWYGITWTCLHCGDRFADGTRMERPFARGWRQESIRRGEAMWNQAVAWRGPTAKAWLAEQLSDGAA